MKSVTRYEPNDNNWGKRIDEDENGTYVLHEDYARDVAALEKQIGELREHLSFTVAAAEQLYQPERDLPFGMSPTFYHTLTYEGDRELQHKTYMARKALAQQNSEDGK